MSQIDASTADSLRTKMMAFAETLSEPELELFARVILEAGPEVSGYADKMVDVKAEAQIQQTLSSMISDVMKNLGSALNQAARG